MSRGDSVSPQADSFHAEHSEHRSSEQLPNLVQQRGMQSFAKNVSTKQHSFLRRSHYLPWSAISKSWGCAVPRSLGKPLSISRDRLPLAVRFTSLPLLPETPRIWSNNHNYGKTTTGPQTNLNQKFVRSLWQVLHLIQRKQNMGGVVAKHDYHWAMILLFLKLQVSPLLHPPGRMQDSAGMEQGSDYRNIRWAGLPSCHWTPAPWGGKEKVCFSSKVHTTSSAVLQKNLQPAAQSLLMISQKQNNFIVSTQSTSDLKAMYVLSRLPHQE